MENSHKLVFLDIDGTILNGGFDLTKLPALAVKVSDLQRARIVIGINSDRGLNEISEVAQMIGATGPLIAEKGNIVFDQENQTQYVRQDGIIGDRQRVYQIILPEFMSILYSFSIRMKDLLVVYTPGQLISTRQLLNNAKINDGTNFQMILCNLSRQTSLAFVTKTVTPKGLINNPQLLKEVTAEATRIFTIVQNCKGINTPELDVYTDPENFCSTIMHFGETSKQHGIRLMRQKIPWTYEKEIFMIGDSHYDFLHPETKHLGVSNAAGKFKEKCDFVAEHDHAHGVIDCLDWILKH